MHARRVAVSTPVEEQWRKPASQVDALCCTCGNVRKVNSDYRRHQDPSHDASEQGQAEGWLRTQSLKCEPCGGRTRHALLHPSDARWRDSDERRQRMALGGSDPDWSYTDDHLKRTRDEYFAKFPRNPKLRHRYWVKDAKTHRKQGDTTMKALCGADMDVPSKASSKKDKSKGESDYALVKPERIDWDTEFEDPETGMWWVDMECVDCLRLANDHRRDSAKERALFLIDWYSDKIRNGRLEHTELDELVTFLGPAAEATFDRWQREKNTTSADT
nr:hypothetical protein [Mycolicibacterium neoaurum]